MDDLGHIDRFIAEAGKARNLEEMFVVLRRQIERLGFDRFSYELMWPPDGGCRPLHITSYPAGWIDRYIEKRYAPHDLVCRFSAQMVRPFLWDEVSGKGNLTDSQRLVFQEGREAGLKNGASVPIHGPGAAKAYLAVANALAEEEFAKLFLRHRHELQLIATYAHECILALGIQTPPQATVRLTPREIDVMSWVARGKTRWEIAEILGISEETVKNHLEHASARLGVNNKTHAAALALVHGLISL
jgi:DNA-binding CsgD family transcriptional regulator